MQTATRLSSPPSAGKGGCHRQEPLRNIDSTQPDPAPPSTRRTYHREGAHVAGNSNAPAHQCAPNTHPATPSLHPAASRHTCHREGAHVAAALQGWGKALVVRHTNDGGRGAVGSRKVNHVACRAGQGDSRAGQEGRERGCMCRRDYPPPPAAPAPTLPCRPGSAPFALTSHEQVCRILLQPCHYDVGLQQLQHRLHTHRRGQGAGQPGRGQERQQ
jgi:hypothetical protein